MSSLDKRLVESSLAIKGFVQSEGDHHWFIYYTKDGKKTAAKTKTSHSKKSKTLDDYLISAMAKQCKLTKADFELLIECPLTRDMYEERLRAASII